MNNPNPPEEHRIGKWISDLGLDIEKAVLWPHQDIIAEDMIKAGDVDRVVGITPKGWHYRGEQGEKVSVAFTTSHSYTGDGFDFEYGWAIADDTITALEPQIEPETNLHQYEYNDKVERDESLDNAFARITATTDRLLDEEDSTVLYSMAKTERYQLPELAENPVDNEIEYAERIAEHLQEHGFETEIIHYPERSKNVYLSGQR